MRHVRKLFLSVAAATTAIAFAASTASAQTVEVNQEDGGHCGPVTIVDHVPTGGCSIRVVSTQPVLFVRHVSGVGELEFSQCESVFEMRVNENGHGYIYNQELTPEGASCGREPCDEAESGNHPHRNLPWEAQLREPLGGENEEILRMTLCLIAFDAGPTEGQAGTPCTLDIAVAHVEHAMEFSTPYFDPVHNGGTPCINLGGIVEIEGHWVSSPNENHPNLFEIHHLDDEAG
jgi:hypothetical protein